MKVIVHYDEIGLKGKNRGKFEDRLVSNIKSVIKCHVKKEFGYILVETSDDVSKLTKVPGIAFYAEALESSLELDDIKAKVLELLKGEEFESFRIKTVRHNKQYKMTSPELDRELGSEVVVKLGKKVSLKEFDKQVFVAVCNKNCYLYLEKVRGVGGLPVGTAGKVVSLLSGGLDSPVASYLMMKRGCEVVFVHFVNYSQNKESVLGKIEKLVSKLKEYQGKAKLYVVPFDDIQKELILKVKADYRMVMYRRFMMKIAEEVMVKEGALGLVTGDSLAQVASQTLENLNCVYSVVSANVYSPLIGMNKQEVVDISRKIGTFEISSIPYGDCCSFFIAKHPVTKGKVEDCEKFDDLLDVQCLVKGALEKVKVV
jgi:tRNA uracil 4-sulfurtransferase